MFGGKRIAELENETQSLKSMLQRKEEVIASLQYSLEQKTAAEASYANSANGGKEELLAILLASYEDGMKFLQNTIEDNLIMLGEINTLNES